MEVKLANKKKLDMYGMLLSSRETEGRASWTRRVTRTWRGSELLHVAARVNNCGEDFANCENELRKTETMRRASCYLRVAGLHLWFGPRATLLGFESFERGNNRFL